MFRPFLYGCARAGTFMVGTMLAAAFLTPLRVCAADPSKPTTPTAAPASSGTAGTTSAGATSSGATSRTPTTPGVSSDRDVIAYINKYIRQGWTDNGIVPSAPATEYEWCRRVYLDLLGRVPKVEELTKFSSDRSPDRRLNLVRKLTESDEYVEEYARNFTTQWTNILIGRTGGTGNRTNVSRTGMQQYLRRAFLTNKPYDEMVYELVSAEGANQPGEKDYQGAVNFLLDNLDEKAAPATAKVAKVFLGLQVQCTQCHNHPFNDWKQDAFWQMNAFFRQTQALRSAPRNQRDAVVRLRDGDFRGEGQPADPKEAEIYWEQRNGVLKVSFPVFVDGTPIKSKSGFVGDVRRRDELAKMIRSSPQMSKAIVNRTWGHFFGYGFTKPIDDMGPHNQATHPELLDKLGADFAKQGFDLRQLIRWITLSEAYSLSSKFVGDHKHHTGGNYKDDPSRGERPLFSHFYLRQMRAEELYESLIAASDAQKARGSYEEQEKMKNQWLRQFAVAFGTDENDETTTFNGTIPQTLMMWNGELIQKAISGEGGTMLHRVATDPKVKDKIGYLYMAALGRGPTKAEKDVAEVAWKNHRGDALKAVQDVFWVVLNSNEFILQH